MALDASRGAVVVAVARFLCTGDDQIGSGHDLGLTPGERLADQEACWKWRVDLAHELGCDAILYAGDAFETDVPTPEQYEAFGRPARASGIPIIAISGNGRHDGAKRTPNALERVRDTRLLEVYRLPAVREVAGVSIAMLPWAPVDHWVASANGGDRDAINRNVADAILDVARGMYADVLVGPSVLLGHWHVDAATTPNGMGVGNIVREPLLDYAALEAIGFDAIVLGHNHLPQMLGERGFHVGSPMAVNFGEAGYEHVVWLLDIDPAGGEMQAFQIPVPGRRLMNLHVELTDAPGWAPIAGVEDAIVKAKVRATEEQARRLDVGTLKLEILQAGAYMVAGIAVDVTREAKNAVAVDETIGDVEVMEMYLDAKGIEGDRLEALLERHVGYVEAGAR